MYESKLICQTWIYIHNKFFYIVFIKKCTTIMKCHRSQNKKFLVSGNGICCTVSVEVGYQLKVNQKSGDLKSNLLGFYYPEKIRTYHVLNLSIRVYWPFILFPLLFEIIGQLLGFKFQNKWWEVNKVWLTSSK